MRVSLRWLSEFVSLQKSSISEISDHLTRAGVEVEEVVEPGRDVAGVVVAQIQTVAPHPKADRLQICEVFDGSDTFQVVCGATNCRAGLRVAYAQVGAQLPGFSIAQRSLRGVESHGMLCAASELGLSETSDAGIWELPEELTLGQNVLEALELSPVWVLGITPNRPDLLSHLGVARELAASMGLRRSPIRARVKEHGPEAAGLVRVAVDASEFCPRYAARLVRNVKVGPSPEWLQVRLRQVGQRPINNVVDATNFVLMELGQPMHAFDAAHLAGEAGSPLLRVRTAREGEELTTLDGVCRKLSSEDHVIADGQRAVALAGVMGGALSQVSQSTTTVLLESAWFMPSKVRATAKRHGLRTESSYRFERGCDPGIVHKALDRCAQLLGEHAQGEVAKGIVEVRPKGESSQEVILRLDTVPRVLGIELPAEEVVELLEPLDIRCIGRNERSLRFQIPSFRPDLSREVDLIEELARRYGYDNIPARLSLGVGSRGTNADLSRLQQARNALLASGCSEAITYGFGKPKHHEDGEGPAAIRLLNPVSDDHSALRTWLLPGLLEVLARNVRQGQRDVRLFEVGTVFLPQEPNVEADQRDKDLPKEERRIAMVIAGGRHDGRWYEQGERVDVSDVLGLVENVLGTLGLAHTLERRLVQSSERWLAPASAEFCFGKDLMGRAGQLHPGFLAKFQIDVPVYAAELHLGELLTVPRKAVAFRPIGRKPGTRRDVSVIAPINVAAEDIRQFFLAHAGGKLGSDVISSVRLFDVYQGANIPNGGRSLGFAINYRSVERTLTDDEVGEAFETVLANVASTLGVEVRAGAR